MQDPTKLPKQTIDGKQAYFAKLPPTNPLMKQAKRAYTINERRKELDRQLNEIRSEHKKIMLEIMSIKEDQQMEINRQFDVEKLPTKPAVFAKLIEDQKDKSKFTGIAFFTELDIPRAEKYMQTKADIEEMLEL